VRLGWEVESLLFQPATKTAVNESTFTGLLLFVDHLSFSLLITTEASYENNKQEGIFH